MSRIRLSTRTLFSLGAAIAALSAQPAFAQNAAAGDTPVSYTHLDVYKRQKLYEARGRLGGRVLTANNAPEPGLNIEDGGNLINTCLLYTSRCV